MAHLLRNLVLFGLVGSCSAFGNVRSIAEVKSRANELKEAYDYIVVGGGTSGFVVADRLSEDGTSTFPSHSSFSPFLSLVHRIPLYLLSSAD